MSCPFYDLYGYKPNKGELLSKFLVYNKETLDMCVMIPFSQPGFMGSKVELNTSVCDK
jgi:hypothetical protein